MDTEAQWFQKTDRLQILKDIAESLNEANDVSASMAAILPRLSEVLGLTTAWAFRYDPKRGSFVEVGASALPPALSCNHAAPLKSGWCECQDQFVQGKLNTAVNIVRCSRLRDAEGDKQGLTHHASIPLRSKGNPLGILNVAASGHQAFTDSALSFLETIGHQVAIAVDRASILADERDRARKLHIISEIATELVGLVQPSKILQYACDSFVSGLGYEACGVTAVTQGDGAECINEVLAKAVHPLDPNEQEYSYSPLAPEPNLIVEAHLLDNARSVLVHPVPNTPYTLRLESQFDNAFHDADRDLIRIYAWHLTAALENAKLYDHSLKSAKWTERRQLAADLHDAVSQRLFSALLLAQTARLQLNEGHDKGLIEETMEKVQQMIADSQQEMRDLIKTLRPNDERTLITRIRERIEPLQLQFNTRISFNGEDTFNPPLTFDQREALLKVIDEAIQNILKHARAKHANISTHSAGGDVIVNIEDDGIGFDEQTVKLGLGTSTMYERMQQVGGTLTIRSRPGRGTVVSCRIGQHRP